MTSQHPEHGRGPINEKAAHGGMAGVPDDVREISVRDRETPLSEAAGVHFPLESEQMPDTPDEMFSAQPLTAEELEAARERHEAAHTTERKTKTTRRIIGGTVVAGLLAGAGIFAATRGGGSDTPEPRKSPTASGPATPGPSTTPTTQGESEPVATNTPEKKTKNDIYTGAIISDEALPMSFLEKMEKEGSRQAGAKELRNILVSESGVKFSVFLGQHKSALLKLTPEQIANTTDTYNEIIDAKYTGVDEAGVPIRKKMDAADFFGETQFLDPENMTKMNRLFAAHDIKTDAAKARDFASSVAVSDTAISFWPARQLQKTNEAIEKWNTIHGDDQIDPTQEITVEKIVQGHYAGDVKAQTIQEEVFSTLPGESFAAPIEGQAYIVDSSVDVDSKYSPDGSVEVPVKSVTVLYKNTANQVVLKTLVAVPVEKYISRGVADAKSTVKDAKNMYVWTTLAVDSVSAE